MKLNYKRTTLIGLAFLSISMFWGFYDAVIAKMLIDSFGMSQLGSGIIMTLDNVLALILLPVFGMWSDKTKTKWGKRTPFIFIGLMVAAFLIVGVAIVDFYQQIAVEGAGITAVIETITGEFVFTANSVDYTFATKLEAVNLRTQLVWEQVTTQNPIYLILFIVVLLFVLLAMSAYRTPAVSLMPDVTPKPLRSKANAIINLMGAVGAIFSLLMIGILAPEYEPYITVFVVLALTMLVILVFFMATVKEVKWTKEMNQRSVELGLETQEDIEKVKEGVKEKMPKDVRLSFILILASVFLWFFGFNAVTSKFSVYASSVLQITNYALPLLVANGVAVIAFIPLGYLATAIGRKKTILIGASILTASMLVAIFLTPTSSFLIYMTMGTAGIGWAAINVNSYPMIVEMSHGANIGKYTGYYYTASMSAQIFTPILSGWLMDQAALGGLLVLFPYSTIFVAASFVTMLFVRHGDSKPIKKGKLEALAGAED
jgi:maltose/moltooligosaccharide transporter